MVSSDCDAIAAMSSGLRTTILLLPAKRPGKRCAHVRRRLAQDEAAGGLRDAVGEQRLAAAVVEHHAVGRRVAADVVGDASEMRDLVARIDVDRMFGIPE